MTNALNNRSNRRPDRQGMQPRAVARARSQPALAVSTLRRVLDTVWNGHRSATSPRPLPILRPTLNRFLIVQASCALLATSPIHPASASDSSETDPAAIGRLIASPEPDWPQWRGPRRDGISDETGLLQEWPGAGPTRLWQSQGLGRGYSAPIVVADRIYLAGDHSDGLRIHALDLAGQQVWTAPNGRVWERPYPGARAACTYSEGHLYHLNAHGRLVCLQAATGREVWAVELFEQFGGRNITWALSECVIVDGDRVIATPGGTRALVVALNKRTGETVWTSEPLRLGPSPSPAHERLADPVGVSDHPSYASPVLFELGGRRQLVGCSLRHAFGVDADTGRLLWTRPYPTRYEVIAATPVLVDDAVFVTAPDTSEGGKLYRLRETGGDVEVQTVWTTPLDTCHGGVVRVGDSLIGSWYRKQKGWASVDIRTGTVQYELRDLAKGAVLYADRRLYCLSEEGEMALLEAGPDAFEVRGRFRWVEGRVNDVWTHPVIHRGRLLLRHHDTLSAYDILHPPAGRK
jgi:outer membrane protein assembly factor BamB